MKEEDKLLSKLRNGDTEAYGEIWRRWRLPVLKFVLAIVKDEAVAADLTQDVLMKVWTERKNITSLRHWIFTVARNAAVSSLRKSTRVENQTPEHLEVESHGYNWSETDWYKYQENLRNLADSLPAQRKKVFLMSRLETLSNQEIADRMGISVRTVEKHLELALHDLRSRLS